MPDDEWIKTLGDGRRVKFTDEELKDWAFITAQIEGNEVVLTSFGTAARKRSDVSTTRQHRH